MLERGGGRAPFHQAAIKRLMYLLFWQFVQHNWPSMTQKELLQYFAKKICDFKHHFNNFLCLLITAGKIHSYLAFFLLFFTKFLGRWVKPIFSKTCDKKFRKGGNRPKGDQQWCWLHGKWLNICEGLNLSTCCVQSDGARRSRNT